ncbi:MAG: nicotinate phosphoribosyltransferase [Mycoplasmataceae bacterium]|jgi:nicotinate phosphoribosyltransferase|nr:nicotinate phosphoribosyltransferase [Mycoplasmataceae bacterium]
MIKFKFDPRLKDGYYSASYFNKSTNLVKKYKPNENVCMQFVHFGNEPVKVCGVSESVQLLQAMLTKQELKQINVYGKSDGDLINGKKPVMLICGPYQLFGKYENVIDGILARRSSVTNNCYQMLRLIKSSQLIYMADRTDDYLIQPYDGYAAYIGGVRNFVTDASVEFIKNYRDVLITGTIPHALIQEFDGDLNETMKAYIKEFGNAKSVALVDYHNDVGSEIKKLSTNFKNIFAVRVDTSNGMLDKGLRSKFSNVKSAYGVSPQLIEYTRKTLNDCGMKQTKIIASSGINNAKIMNFKKHKSPIDFYGVGSNLITRNVHFTADLVLKNGHHEAKDGRKLFININRIKTLKKYI